MGMVEYMHYAGRKRRRSLSFNVNFVPGAYTNRFRSGNGLTNGVPARQSRPGTVDQLIEVIALPQRGHMEPLEAQVVPQ